MAMIARRRHLALILGAALALAGCTEMETLRQGIESVGSAKITQKEAYLAALAFDGIEVTVTQYYRAPACNERTRPICHDVGTLQNVRAAELSGRSARNNIKAYLRAHSTDSDTAPVSNTADVSAVRAAYETLRALLAAYMAAKGA